MTRRQLIELDHLPCSGYGGARANIALMLLLLVMCTSGCHLMNRYRPSTNLGPVVLQPTATLPQVILAVNEHSQRVRQLKTDVRISMPGVPALRGDLMIERPERLRMTASLMGLPGFDLGSNERYFWIWKQAATPGDPPALYYASHVEYQTSTIKEQLQLQPKFLMDGLGLISFDPSERHSGPVPRADGLIEVTTYPNSGSGDPIRVAVIDAQRGTVVRQTFYDQNRNRIAYIDSGKFQYYAENQVSLPQRISVHVYDPAGNETELVVDAGNFSINALYGDPERIWAMPDPPDVPKIDLSQAMVGQRAEMESAPHVSADWNGIPKAPY